MAFSLGRARTTRHIIPLEIFGSGFSPWLLQGPLLSLFPSMEASVMSACAALNRGVAAILRRFPEGGLLLKEMQSTMKCARTVYLFVFLLAMTVAMALQAGASTVTAASCNQSDVNAVINGPTHVAVPGDVIQVPAGTCTWKSELSVTVPITLIGLGANPNTSPSTYGAGTLGVTIIDGQTGNAGAPMMYFSGLKQGQTLTIQNLVIQPISSANLNSPIWIGGTCNSTGCPQIRVTNINFSGWSSASGSSAWGVRLWNVFGVFDHNSIDNSHGAMANVNLPSYQGIGQYGDNSWAQPDTLGSASAVYFENNLFTNGAIAEDTDSSDVYADVGGGRIVVRFNQASGLTNSLAYNHGTETTGRPRGGRQMEAYANDVSCSANCFAPLATFRSGTGMIWGNLWSAEGSGSATSLVAAMVIRAYRGPATPWGNCDGTGAYDNNDSAAYASGKITAGSSNQMSITDGSAAWSTSRWVNNGNPYSIRDVTQGFGAEISANTSNTFTFTTPPRNNTNSPMTWNVGDSYEVRRASVCIDQPGRGKGKYISGATPASGWVQEELDPIYEFDDSVSGPMYNSIVNSNGTAKIVADRDWYSESKGQSAQISSTSPFNGTSGTGHGTLANRPTSCTAGVGYWATDQGSWNQSSNRYAGGYSQGEFYKCTATNSWTLAYEPYTYPHPLVTGSSAVGPNPPTNLTGTVN